MSKLYLILGVLVTTLVISVLPVQAKDQVLTDSIVNQIVSVAKEGQKTRRVARVVRTQAARLDKRPDYEQVRILLRTISDGLKRCGTYACGENDVKSLLNFTDKLYAVAVASQDPEIRAFKEVAQRLASYVRVAANMSL